MSVADFRQKTCPNCGSENITQTRPGCLSLVYWFFPMDFKWRCSNCGHTGKVDVF